MIHTGAFQWLSPTGESPEKLGLVCSVQRSQAEFGGLPGTPFHKVRLGVAALSRDFVPWLSAGRVPALEGRVHSLLSITGADGGGASRLRPSPKAWRPGQPSQLGELASGGIEDVTLFKVYRIFRRPMYEKPPLVLTDTLMFAFERTTGELVYIDASRSELFWFRGLPFEQHELGLWLAQALRKVA
ncbi:MAG TPA: hypothetical protein VK550_16160 [Polyangiaceae bacterium]|nr:hypothetical protein [Polyangiaceae bacterium]